MSPIPKPEATTKGVITDWHELHRRMNEAVGTRYAIDDTAAQYREFDRQHRIEGELLEDLFAKNLLEGEAKRAAQQILETNRLREERKDW